MKAWAFIHYKTGERIDIEAIDGPTARKIFRLDRAPEISQCFDINCVCPCGKAQQTAYCSRECYDKATENLVRLHHGN